MRAFAPSQSQNIHFVSISSHVLPCFIRKKTHIAYRQLSSSSFPFPSVFCPPTKAKLVCVAYSHLNRFLHTTTICFITAVSFSCVHIYTPCVGFQILSGCELTKAHLSAVDLGI